MSILSVNFLTTGLSEVKPSVIQINTNNTLAEVIVTGYLNSSITIYGNIYSNIQMALVNTTDQGPAWFRVVVEGVNVSLVLSAEQGTVSSVGITGTDFTITNSPITSAGNIGLILNTVPLNKGGTNNTLVANAGGIVWSDATKLQILPGTIAAGQVLVSGSNSAPTWQSVITPTFVGKNQLVYGIETDETAGLSTSLNGTLVTNNTGTPSILSGPGTTGNILQSNASAAPSFSTAIYPSTTMANQLLYSSSNNTITGLSSSANATLVTDSSNIPSISQTLPSVVQTNITALGTQAQALNMGSNEISGLVTSGALDSAATVALVQQYSRSASFSNMLFNGSMLVWQRGITFTLTTGFAYAADRWQYGTSGTSSVFAEQFISANQTFLKVGRISGNSSTAEIKCGQSLTYDMGIEARDAVSSSPQIFISFDARCGTTSRGFGTLFVKVTSGTNSTNVSNLSTGFTSPVNVISTSSSLGTSKVRYYLTGTLSPTNFTQLAVEFSVIPSGTATSSDWFAISNVQLQMGEAVGFYNSDSYAAEISRCSYFYQARAGAAGYSVSPGSVQFGLAVGSPMRTAPTLNATGVLVVTDGIANYTALSVGLANYMTSYGGLAQFNNFTGIVALRPVALNALFNGNLITLDSELY
jgi:hypothetical protein